MPAVKEIPVQIQAISVVPDADRFRQELKSKVEGEVRFDPVSRALYSTDASVYQIQPVGVVIPRNREDIMRSLEICRRYRCPSSSRTSRT